MRAKKQFGNEFDANRQLKETARMCRHHYPQRSHNNSVLYVALTVVFLILAAMAISGFKDDALAMQDRQYCDLVALHKQNPDLGWPDFDKRFERDCNADGTVKEVK